MPNHTMERNQIIPVRFDEPSADPPAILVTCQSGSLA